MINRSTVAAALASIAEMQGREVTEAQVKAVHAVIGAEFDDRTFAAACRHVARTCKWMPTPADFLSALEADHEDAAEEAAGQAWAMVLGNKRCQVYSPTAGTRYDPPKIAEVAGPEAAEAWLEAGVGPLQTSDEKTLSFARRDFVQAFVRRRRRMRRAEAGLLTAGPVRHALPPPRLELPPSKEEAAELTRKVEDRAGIARKGIAAARAAARPRTRPPLTDEEVARQKKILAAEAAGSGGQGDDGAE